MTWYAMALLIAPLGAGAALFSHAQMLHAAPLLIDVLVWLTRILLISSVTLTLERFMQGQAAATTTAPPTSTKQPSPNVNCSPKTATSHSSKQEKKSVAIRSHPRYPRCHASATQQVMHWLTQFATTTQGSEDGWGY